MSPHQLASGVLLRHKPLTKVLTSYGLPFALCPRCCSCPLPASPLSSFALLDARFGVSSSRSPQVVPASQGHSGGNSKLEKASARMRRGLRRRHVHCSARPALGWACWVVVWQRIAVSLIGKQARRDSSGICAGCALRVRIFERH